MIELCTNGWTGQDGPRGKKIMGNLVNPKHQVLGQAIYRSVLRNCTASSEACHILHSQVTVFILDFDDGYLLQFICPNQCWNEWTRFPGARGQDPIPLRVQFQLAGLQVLVCQPTHNC